MIQTQDLSIELAEKSLLGTMLAENYLIADGGFEAEHFTSQVHRNIFTSMQSLVATGKPVDYITLLTVREPMEVGGANYLVDLNNFASPVKFDDYREIVVAHWRERKKAYILQQAQQEAWTIDNIQKTLDDIQGSSTEPNTSIMADLVALGDVPYKPGIVSKGVTTGLADMDKMLNGFQRKELTIIAARPSMGKTDTLDHLAMAAGWAGYLPIIFSLEMSRETLLTRLIAAAGNFNRLKMRDPYEHFSDDQKEKWLPTLNHLSQTKIEIDDRAGLTVAQMRARARNIIKANPERQPIIYIDYLQIIRGANPKDNQTQIIGQISWDLKQMAKEFNCPVVCLSQLNRGVEGRQDKRPMMSDLRDSGNIEQDADVIMLLYRDDYYDKESESKNMLEFIIAKHRNGPTGTVQAVYVKETGRLMNMAWAQGGATK